MRNTISSLLGVFLVIVAMNGAFAAPDGGNSMNALCQAKGFDYGIAKWQYGGNGPWELVDSIEGHGTDVTGSKDLVEYSASPSADGVLSNGGSTVYDGASGTIEKGVNHNGNIEQVTFCGYSQEVPEFSGVAALAGVGLLGAAVVAFRRRD